MNYKWWYGNQDVTRDRIRRELDGNVKYHEHSGNIWSIRYKNRPVFIAHMDTVKLCNESARLYIKKGKLKRQGSALGADDRAGINLIMNHHEKINFIFTRDEEIGRLGAIELASHEPFLRDLKKVSCVVELDCTGHKKIRGAVHGYCQADLVAAIKKVIPDITDTHGSYSDLDSFIPWKAGVNLSVGYYKQHTNNEYLVISEFEYVDSIIRALDKELRGEYKIYVKPPKRYYHWKTKSWETYPVNIEPAPRRTLESEIAKRYQEQIEREARELAASNEFVCDACSHEAVELIYVHTVGMYLCAICIQDLISDLKVIEERGGLIGKQIDVF